MSDALSGLAHTLAEQFASWRREPVHRHLLALAALMAVVAARWWRYVLAPIPQNDESIYFAAFEAVVRGDSPYTPTGYLTFSLLAYAGGWAVEHLGQPVTLAILRVGNLLGVAAAVWCSMAWIPWRWERRLLAGAVYAALAPAVAFGVIVGNLSLLVAGLLIASLLFWPYLPRSCGAMLGLSVAAKPVAPGAILTLLLHRSSTAGRRHLIAAGVAIGVAAVVVLAPPHLGELLAKDVWPRLGRSVSPHRFAWLLGLRGSVLFLSAAAVLLAVVVARTRRLGPTQCYALATTAAIAATPLVWSHTLLATLPLQVLSILLLLHRRAERRAGDGNSPQAGLGLETVLVVLAVAALQLAEGATNIYDQHLLIQWLGSTPPALAPAALTGYLLRHTTEF